MELSLRRWKPGQLLLSWGAYWVGLIGVTTGSAINASWRATQLPENHGSISAGFNNGILNYSVVEEGVTTYAGTAPLSTVLLWLVGPPLLLWLVWLIVRERPAKGQAVVAGTTRDALSDGSGPATEFGVRQDRVRVERDD